MSFVLRLVITVLVAMPSRGTASRMYNVAEYRALCSIYRVVLKHCGGREENYVSTKFNWDGVAGMLNDVTELTAETSGANESSDEAQTESGVRGLVKSVYAIRLNATAAFTASRLKRLKDRIAQLKKEAEAKAKQAIGELKKAAGSESALCKSRSTQVKVSMNYNRSNICNSTSKGGEAGVSLVTDLLCLCASGEKNNQTCGFVIESGIGIWTDSDTKVNDEMWQKISRNCLAQKVSDELSMRNLNILIDRFHKLLGAQVVKTVHENEQRRWFLGHAGSLGGNCSGKEEDDICVNYARSDNTLDTIAWLDHVTTARDALVALESKVSLAEQLERQAMQIKDMFEHEISVLNISDDGRGAQWALGPLRTSSERGGGDGDTADVTSAEAFESSAEGRSVRGPALILFAEIFYQLFVLRCTALF
ncbi:Variant surface glycoprotein [Trypanosoma congolense IL3000]|uniref:Variant surface glycoprotein n=1 Tax=Trypanosoma congolense (strain IL3000) TaxID=1068625 RepID=F9W940_TRYCI|nr:Variant surface glycoprotein [Trypanosoma congolense IL3000]